MEIELPENFPFEKPPKKGDKERFLVEAECMADAKKGGKYPWKIETIDGVPMDTAGKAAAPGDEGSAEEEAAESPEEEAAEGDEGEAAETPTPTAEMPEQADQSAGPSVGASFAKSVMNPSQ